MGAPGTQRRAARLRVPGPALHLAFGLALCLGAAMPAAAQSISALVQQSERERGTEAAAPDEAAIPAPARGATVPVPVPAVALYPGDTISAGMLITRELPLAALDKGGLAGHAEALVGKTVRRALAAGQPVPLNALTETLLVTKGVATRIQLRDGGLAISGYAMPLESAAAGAVVRLKNMETGQIVVGEVEADGTVRIRMR